jgi:hypothetical protein
MKAMLSTEGIGKEEIIASGIGLSFASCAALSLSSNCFRPFSPYFCLLPSMYALSSSSFLAANALDGLPRMVYEGASMKYLPAHQAGAP